jgi:hypothetical protein
LEQAVEHYIRFVAPTQSVVRPEIMAHVHWSVNKNRKLLQLTAVSRGSRKTKRSASCALYLNARGTGLYSRPVARRLMTCGERSHRSSVNPLSECNSVARGEARSTDLYKRSQRYAAAMYIKQGQCSYRNGGTSLQCGCPRLWLTHSTPRKATRSRFDSPVSAYSK